VAQIIQIGMDVTDVKSASNELIEALQKNSSTVESLFRKMAIANKEGEIVKQVFGGITAEGDKVEATLKKVATGWEVLNTKVVKAARSIKEAKDAGAVAATAAKGSQVESILDQSFNTGRGLPSGSLNTVDSAIQRIKDLVASGKVELDSFQRILDQFSKDPKALFPGLTAEEAKIVRALRSIQNQIDRTADAREKAAKKVVAAAKEEENAQKRLVDAAIKKNQQQAQSREVGEVLKSNFKFEDVNPAKISQVEAAIARVKAIVSSGAVSVQRFAEILATVKADPKKVIPDLTTDEQRLTNSLRTIIEGFKKTDKAVAETKSIFISLGGVLRLLEAQLLKRIFATFEGEIIASVAAAQKFMLQIAEIRTISQDAQLSTQRWSSSITELSNAFGRTQSDVAEAAYQTLSNQVAKGAESFKFLESALGFSQASVSTATDSVNLLSGALKSFQLPLADTERIAAILFKTIELGRVRAREMADTFGRVGTIASDAGVKLEEVSAAIAVLTNRGIKFNDSSTLIQNILLKLIRPTDEMKKLFEEWGVSSGTAAIATFGFAGVLQKLDQEAAKGTGRIGDLLGQIRAIRGTVGLTGGAFNDFQDSLRKITGAQKEYENAKKEVQESPGQRAAQQMIQLRNYFEQDFGEPFLKGLVRIVEGMGGAANAAKGLLATIQLTIGGYIAYRGVLIALHPAMQTEIALTAASSLAKRTLTATTTALSVAYTYLSTTSFPAMLTGLGAVTKAALAAATPVAALAIAFGGSYYVGDKIFSKQLDALDNVISKSKQASIEAEKVRKGIGELEEKGVSQTTEKVKEEYKKRFQTVLTFSTNVLKEANRLKVVATDNLKAITENLKTSSGTYFESLRRNVSRFNEEANRAKSEIRQSLRESEDLPRRGSNAIFNEKLKFASPGNQDNFTGFIANDQQIELLKARILQLAAQAREEFAKGTKEGAEEGRKLFNDVQQLQSQLFQKQTENERKQFEFRVKQGQVAPTIGPDGQARYEFTVRTKDIESQINSLTQERLALEEQYRQVQSDKQKQQESLAAKERERIRLLQQQFMLLEKIDVFNKEGKLKNEYKGPEGTERALREFETRRKKILELASQDSDPGRGFQVFIDLQKQRDSIINQIRTAQNVESAQKIQEGAGRDIQNIENLATKAQEKIRQETTEIDRLLSGVNRQIDVFKASLDKPIKIDGIRTDKESEPARNKALEKVDDLKAARDAFNASGGRTVENANKVRQAIEALNAATLEYIRLRNLGSPDKISFGADKGRSVKDQIGLSTGVGQDLVTAATSIEQTKNKLDAALNTAANLDQRLKNVPGALRAMAEASINSTPVVQSNFQTLANAAANYANELERINNALNNQPGLNPIDALPNVPAEGRMFGGKPPEYMKYGGFVNFVPRGSDNVPAMLSKKEYVMNEDATKMFAPLLRAMNSGGMPKYMNNGGPVTNVGDITVNVSGGQTDGQSLRNIAQGLRRGIRRGTINLG